MEKPRALHAATSDEVAGAASFALCYQGRKCVHHADEMSARIAADRLVQHLDASGFVVMRKPAAVAPNSSAMPTPGRQVVNAVSDKVINAEVAQSLSADVARDHGLVGWVVVRDQPTPSAFVARLVTDEPTPYALQAATLEELRAQLPPGLTPSGPQPADPSDLVEIWFLTSRVVFLLQALQEFQ